MKNSKILMFIVLSLLFATCATVDFTKLSSKNFPALPETEEVDIILNAKPDYKVEQIGFAKVYGPLEYSIDDLKKNTRLNGGNVAILTEVGVNPQRIEFRTFEIAKKIK